MLKEYRKRVRGKRGQTIRLGRLAVAAIGLLIVGNTYAVGLGKLKVRSGLDQPLVARIELATVEAAELETLEARLAASEDFARAGVERADFLNKLIFEVERDAPTPYIAVTTKQAAAEPFLHFLVTVQWAGGKLVREYTALLDPPTYAIDKPAPVSSPRVVGTDRTDTAGAVAAPEPLSPIAAEPGTGGPPAASEPPDEGVLSAEYGPIQVGDTLWSIASTLDVGTAKVNVFQIMIALLRENPDAFVNLNINRLRVGKILRLGNVADIANIPKQQASSAYTAQLEEWQAYKLQLAKASPQLTVPATATAEPSPDQAPTSAPQPAGPPPGEALRILRGDVAAGDAGAKTETAAGQPGGADSAELQSLRLQIDTLDETLLSRELENKELRERVAQLESQVDKANRLIEIQSEQLAEAQRRSEAPAGPVPAKPKAKAPEAPVMSRAPARPEAQPDTTPKPAAAAKPEPKAAPKPKAKPKPKKPAAKVKPVKVKPVPAVPWWQSILDSLLASWEYMVGLGVAAVALVVGLVQLIRRRRSIAEFEESILTGSVLEGQTETTETSKSAASDTSFLSDFGMAGMGSVQADEVDPLAEAEVYLAYGRDEQAEEVLREAIKKDTQRSELKLKLLEIYQQRNDLKAFETLAEELYPAGGQGDPVVWQQVVAMGRTVNPDNPLFSQEFPVGALTGEDESGDSAEAPTTAARAVQGDSDLRPFPEPSDELNLDTDMDTLESDRLESEPADAEAAPKSEQEAMAVDDFEIMEGPLESMPEDELLDGGRAEFSGSDLSELKPQDQEIDFDLDLEIPDENLDELMSGDSSGENLAEDEFDFVMEPGSATEPVEPELAEPASATVTPIPVSRDNQTETVSPEVVRTESETAAVLTDNGELLTLHEVASPNVQKADLEALAASVNDMDETDALEIVDQDHWDEAATKLDLARAYMDMGDQDGARSIIDEVLKEGNPAQRNQAQELANQLGA